MMWPTMNDFAEAIQNPHLCFGEPHGQTDLRSAQVEFNELLGQPQLWTGASGVVFKVHCPQSGKTWAIKCFTRQVADLAKRYRIVSDHLQKSRLPFGVAFTYLEQGIFLRVGGAAGWYPILKMEWVEGLAINELVAKQIDKPAVLGELAGMWVKMARLLRQADIAHADLQHGNVFMVKQPNGNLALKLVDYDGMYVPGLEQAPSGELGHANYQHPRRQNVFNLETDRYSHLVVYTALRALAWRPLLGSGDAATLWREFDNQENLLFRQGDLENPGQSPLFRRLCNHADPDIQALAGHLLLATVGPMEKVPSLDEVLVEQGPAVVPLTAVQEREVIAILGRASRELSAAGPARRATTTLSGQPGQTQRPRARAATRLAEESQQTIARPKSREMLPRKTLVRLLVAACVVMVLGCGSVFGLLLMLRGPDDSPLSTQVAEVSSPKPKPKRSTQSNSKPSASATTEPSTRREAPPQDTASDTPKTVPKETLPPKDLDTRATGPDTGKSTGMDSKTTKENNKPDAPMVKPDVVVKKVPFQLGQPQEITTGKVSQLAFLADGRHVMTSGDDNLHMWDIEGNKEVLQIKGPKNSGAGLVAVDKTGTRAAYVLNNAAVGLVDPTGNKSLGSIPLNPGELTGGVAVSADGKIVLTTSQRGTGAKVERWLRCWDFDKRALIYQVRLDFVLVFGVAALPEDRAVVVAGRYAAIYATMSGKAIGRIALEGMVRGGWAFSSDGHYLAVGCESPNMKHTCTVVDLQAGKVIAIKDFPSIPRALAFSPDNKFLVLSPEDDRYLHVLDVRDWKVVDKLKGPSGAQKILATAFAPNGKYLVAGGWPQTGNRNLCWAWPILEASGRFPSEEGSK